MSLLLDYPVHLGTDELFVLADLREGGHDSRLYGPIARSQIKGNVMQRAAQVEPVGTKPGFY